MAVANFERLAQHLKNSNPPRLSIGDFKLEKKPLGQGGNGVHRKAIEMFKTIHYKNDRAAR